MTTYYAATNSYANENSIGFSNTWGVIAFASKAARDAYVAKATDLATRAITKREVTQYAKNWNMGRNEYNEPRPFSNEFWGIVDENPEWSAAGRPDGYVGHVTVCDGDTFGLVRRVYG